MATPELIKTVARELVRQRGLRWHDVTMANTQQYWLDKAERFLRSVDQDLLK